MVRFHFRLPCKEFLRAEFRADDYVRKPFNLSVLEASGLIETARGDDLRERMISMTEKGEAVLVAAFPIWTGTQRKLTAKVGNQSVASLMGGLKAVAAAVG